MVGLTGVYLIRTPSGSVHSAGWSAIHPAEWSDSSLINLRPHRTSFLLLILHCCHLLLISLYRIQFILQVNICADKQALVRTTESSLCNYCIMLVFIVSAKYITALAKGECLKFHDVLLIY